MSIGRPPSSTTTQPLVAVQVPLPSWSGSSSSPRHSAYDCRMADVADSATTRMPTWQFDGTTFAPATAVTPARMLVAPATVVRGACQPGVQPPTGAVRLLAPLPVTHTVVAGDSGRNDDVFLSSTSDSRTAWRATSRCAGEPIWPAPLVLAIGASNRPSW